MDFVFGRVDGWGGGLGLVFLGGGGVHATLDRVPINNYVFPFGKQKVLVDTGHHCYDYLHVGLSCDFA